MKNAKPGSSYVVIKYDALPHTYAKNITPTQHLWQGDVLHCAVLSIVEELYSRKGNDHPHWSQASLIHANKIKSIELPPSQV